MKRVLATCLNRANEIRLNNPGADDDWTREGRENITKLVKLTSDFHSYLDFRDDDRATQNITNNKHSKGIVWAKGWPEETMHSHQMDSWDHQISTTRATLKKSVALIIGIKWWKGWHIHILWHTGRKTLIWK